MASWKPHLDSLVGNGDIIKQAAIVGKDGGIWAITSGFNVSQADILRLKTAFENEVDAQANGIFVEGYYYLVTNTSSRSIYGRKGQKGIICVRTNLAIVIAIYEELAGRAVVLVEKFADSLISQNY